MGQTTVKKVKETRPLLRAFNSDPATKSRLCQLATIGWNFAYSALWNCNQFSTKEIEASKEKIKEYLRKAITPEKGFRAFCERILLARFALLKKAEGHLPLPSAWLDKSNTDGYCSTRIPYRHIRSMRASLPAYQAELRALAEAALEFGEEPTTRNYHYWRQYFIDRDAPGLLSLFQMMAAQQIAST